MSTAIEAVFEKGVFRPLKPVVLPENQRVKLLIEDEALATAPVPPPRRQPGIYPEEYPDDLTDADFEYVPVPPKHVGTFRGFFIYAGEHQPPVYPEEE